MDRASDRPCRLYHAGFVDRSRAQLDRYPTSGSAPMVYALGDLGAELLAERGSECGHLELSRRNRNAGRPFIEHQLEIVDFQVSLDLAVRQRDDFCHSYG
ncbi:replication-relaxation family protein [Bradyrhizobium sp. 195]